MRLRKSDTFGDLLGAAKVVRHGHGPGARRLIGRVLVSSAASEKESGQGDREKKPTHEAIVNRSFPCKAALFRSVREVSARCPRSVRGADTFAPAPPHGYAEFRGLRASTPLPLRGMGVESLGPFLVLVRGGAGAVVVSNQRREKPRLQEARNRECRRFGLGLARRWRCRPELRANDHDCRRAAAGTPIEPGGCLPWNLRFPGSVRGAMRRWAGYSANQFSRDQGAQSAWDSSGETASKGLRWLPVETTRLEDEAPPARTCKPA